MSITAKAGEHKSFEIVPAGNHIARCYQMIEIGTDEKEVLGELKRQYTVRIVWELPNETKVFDQSKGEQPFSIGKDYTLSMHEKSNLRKELQSWRGRSFTEEEAKGFDITKLIGVPCMLNIIHQQSKTGNNYSKIAGVTAIPKGFVCPPQVNASFVLAYDDVAYEAKFATLPEWLRKRIEATPEFKKRLEAPVKAKVSNDDDQELPF